MLTRSRGDFEEILAGSDLVVEVIGGLEPARELRAARDARRQARRHAPTSSCSPARRGAVGGGARARRAAALRGRRRRRRAGHPRAAGVARRRRTSSASTGSSTARRTSSSREMAATGASYDDALAEAQRLGYAEADPTDDVNGRDAAAKMAILARLAFDTPVHLDEVALRGHRAHHRRRHGVRARARPRAQADRHRRARRRRRSASACTRRSSTRGHPLASVSGPFNAVTIESRRDHRDHALRARRRRPADRERGARRRRQRDDPAGLDAADAPSRCAIVDDVESAFYLHLEVADRPGVLAQVAELPRAAGRLDQVGRAEGPGRERAAGDGRPPAARVALLRGRRADRRARLHALARRARSASSRRSSTA